MPPVRHVWDHSPKVQYPPVTQRDIASQRDDATNANDLRRESQCTSRALVTLAELQLLDGADQV